MDIEPSSLSSRARTRMIRVGRTRNLFLSKHDAYTPADIELRDRGLVRFRSTPANVRRWVELTVKGAEIYRAVRRYHNDHMRSVKEVRKPAPKPDKLTPLQEAGEIDLYTAVKRFLSVHGRRGIGQRHQLAVLRMSIALIDAQNTSGVGVCTHDDQDRVA